MIDIPKFPLGYDLLDEVGKALKQFTDDRAFGTRAAEAEAAFRDNPRTWGLAIKKIYPYLPFRRLTDA